MTTSSTVKGKRTCKDDDGSTQSHGTAETSASTRKSANRTKKKHHNEEMRAAAYQIVNQQFVNRKESNPVVGLAGNKCKPLIKQSSSSKVKRVSISEDVEEQLDATEVMDITESSPSDPVTIRPIQSTPILKTSSKHHVSSENAKSAVDGSTSTRAGAHWQPKHKRPSAAYYYTASNRSLAEIKEEEEKECSWARYAAFLCYVLVATLLGVLLGTLVGKKHEKEPGTTHSISTTAPTTQDLNATDAPTGPLDLLLQDIPEQILESLQTVFSPQWKAQQRLLEHPYLKDFPEWRKQQLFALATFYYAMEGPHWPQHYQDQWLQYETDECLWLSTQDFCNEHNEVQHLGLGGDLQLSMLSPVLPPELALLTSLSALSLAHNGIHGSMTKFLPSQLYQMNHLTTLSLQGNSLWRTIPTEFGLMTRLTELDLNRNSLDGSIPSELGLMSALQILELCNNGLTDVLPLELDALTSKDGALDTLTLANNSLSGQVSAGLCSLGEFDSSLGMGSDSTSNEDCETRPFAPSKDDEALPGIFPTYSHAIAISLRTDDYPDETTLDWLVQDPNGSWDLIDSIRPEEPAHIHNYTQEVESSSLYRLHISDNFADGTCCQYGFGWFTISNAYPSLDYAEGTVLWEASGHDFDDSLDVYLWVDSNGYAQLVDHLPGQGYALIASEDEVPIIVVEEEGSIEGAWTNAEPEETAGLFTPFVKAVDGAPKGTP